MVIFSRKDIEIPFVTHDEELWKMLEPGLTKSIDLLNKNISCSTRLQSVLLDLMDSGLCTIEAAALKLNISKRTLQRHLRAESTNFSEVLNHAREQQARYYLTNTKYTYDEISSLLGYDHPNSFSRAFIHWTGKTPQVVRKEK